MRFTNLTRAAEIGANSYLLHAGGKSLLLDCGMHPRLEGNDATPLLSLLPDQLDAAIVTHSHLDHAGSLPVLRRRHQATRVFLSPPTARMNDVLLHNSVNVMNRRYEAGGASPMPLFSHREADLAAKLWQEVYVGQVWSVDGERLPSHEEADLSYEFCHAGHILGSVGVLIREGSRRVLYTGDINFEDQTVTRAAKLPQGPLDALIIETTRGDYERPTAFARADEELRFARLLAEALDAGGSVLVPVFALGKTQEVLAMLLRFFEQGLIPADTPLFIGGLSTRMTEIHDSFAGTGEFHRKYSDLLGRLDPQRIRGDEADTVAIRSGCIYALSSGMMTEGTLSHTFARKMMTLEQNAIFFVGYADPNSPAGHIKAAQTGETVDLGERTPPAELRCRVEKFDFSAHAPRESIRAYVRSVAPRKILLVHGDRPALEWFERTLRADLPGSEIIIPAPGVEIEI